MTENNNDPKQYESLSGQEKKILIDWCSNLEKTSAINKRNNSYSLKHIFSKCCDRGYYLTNGVFIGGMLAAGFEGKRSENSVNFHFNVSSKSIKKVIREYDDRQ